LHVAISALQRGYRIFRKPYAKRVGIPVRELDRRITDIARIWLGAMAEPPSP